jgi:hypothetical protein
VFFLIVGPPDPLGTMICTTLHLHYLWKLLCKYVCAFLALWFLKRRFLKWPTLVLHFFFIIFPLKETWSLGFVQFWIPFTQGWFVPSLILLVLEKILRIVSDFFFFCYNLSLEKELPFNCTILKSLYLRMISINFG